MMFSDQMITALRNDVKLRLSEKRFAHTLGVESAALKIAAACAFSELSEISAAALLHDISKEYSLAEQKNIIFQNKIEICESDELAPQVLHSITAPLVIMRDFAQFATDTVLSAVRKHTTADEDMSLCDEIIFIADYIEDGRTYDSCVNLRQSLYASFESASSPQECRQALHVAVAAALADTFTSLKARGLHIHEKSISAMKKYSDFICDG